MGLEQFHAERFVETSKQLIHAMRALGGIDPNFSRPDQLSDVAKESLQRNQEMAREFKDRPDLIEDLWLTPTDWFRIVFDQAWEDYRLAMQRIDVILHQGDVHLLDVPWPAVTKLRMFWDWLEKGRTTKPDFIEDGPQELARAAIIWPLMGDKLTESIARSFSIDYTFCCEANTRTEAIMRAGKVAPQNGGCWTPTSPTAVAVVKLLERGVEDIDVLTTEVDGLSAPYARKIKERWQAAKNAEKRDTP